MNDRAWPCAVCENWHAPGSCPEGTPAPERPHLEFCPWCRRDGRKSKLVPGINTDDGKTLWVCVVCPFGRVPAQKHRGRRGGRGRVKR